MTVFAALARPASTNGPESVVKRGGFVVFVSPAVRSHPQKLLLGWGKPSFVSQTTFNCAAAWIASYSFGATTERKSLICTT